MLTITPKKSKGEPRLYRDSSSYELVSFRTSTPPPHTHPSTYPQSLFTQTSLIGTGSRSSTDLIQKCVRGDLTRLDVGQIISDQQKPLRLLRSILWYTLQGVDRSWRDWTRDRTKLGPWSYEVRISDQYLPSINLKLFGGP